MNPTKHKTVYAALTFAGAALAVGAQAQTAPAPATAPASAETEEEVIVLSPFEVTASESTGYVATSTLAGSRINTQLKDVGSAISVVTSEFLKDTGATDSKSLLQYTTNTEVASIQGNFTRASASLQTEEGNFTTPNTNTRVRGLTSADNTRGFFMTDIPWDSYNVDRVDMQRGPNAILFGMGSPAGIINTTTKSAQFRNFGELEFRYGSYGANRISFDYNHTLLEDELALRVAAVRNDEQYKQKPAYSLDRRLFATARYEPKFLNKGDHKTSIKLNYESGSIRSNNPRVITPIDYITPWYTALNQATYNPWKVRDIDPRYTYDANDNVATVTLPTGAGQLSRNYGNYIPVGLPAGSTTGLLSGGVNPAYQPWLGGVASSYQGGPLTFFMPGSTVPSSMVPNGFDNLPFALNSAGGFDNTLEGFPNWQRVALVSTRTYANNANDPYSALILNNTLTDPSIFDFYNNLIDGGNKSEWQNFHNFSASLSQTFFKQKFGFEAAYDQSVYRRGQYSLLTDQRAGVMVDLNTHNMDGTPNANLGKPYIADAGIYGNNEAQINREASRVSAYFDHNFNEGGKGNWFMKLLGRHTVSGLYSQDMFRQADRSFMRWGTGLDYAGLLVQNPATMSIKDNRRVLHPVVYLSDTSLIGTSLASGLNIPRAGDEIQLPETMKYQYFNSHWNAAASIKPGDRWINTRTGGISNQSENPANYVGWSSADIAVLDAKNADDRDALTYSAALSKKKSDSRAAVWQAYFWDGAIVGMYGIRRDHVKSWSASGRATAGTEVIDYGYVDPTTGLKQYSTVGKPYSITVEDTPSWSVVGHLTKLLGRWGDSIPVNVSFFYNSSSNFQVSGTRYTIYGNAIAPQSGKTLDRGIAISTKDDRFSLRINKYESNVKDATSTAGLNTWLIGNNGDTLFTWGENRADMYEYNLGAVGDPSSANDGRSWNYNYQAVQKPNGSMQTPEEAAAQEAAAVAGWRAFTATPQVQKFLKAFGYSDFGVIQPTTLQRLPGFNYTEDQVSRGWEFEFTANPLPNWRISMNASKTQATRTNIGGSDFVDFVENMNTYMQGPAGDIRLWWGGSVNDTTGREWQRTFYSNYAFMRLGEGTFSPELRKWRFNLVTNYDFRSGFLKGVSVGLGYRWQDKVAIGYPTSIENGAFVYDLENPYMGPREDAIDFWIGYGKKLSEKIDWRIQLNVRNFGDGNSLIPLTVNPSTTDPRGYTVAAWRIAPGQTWTITNTFKF